MSTSNSNNYDTYKPPLTLFIIGLSVFLFVGINSEPTLEGWDLYRKWGAPSFLEIYGGHYWGLLTSNFLHVELWHIAFNLFWIWIFGKRIEWEESSGFYCFLVITAGLVSSFAQLGFSDTTGIGLSGIGYAFFGFLFVQSRIEGPYHGFVHYRMTILFMAWLILCLIATQLKVQEIANAAHLAGLIWGLAIGYRDVLGKAQHSLFVLGLFLLLGASPWWNPWATSWLSYQAYLLHDAEHAEEASQLYKQVLERDGDNEYAADNLKLLEVFRLSQKAYKLHQDQELEAAIKCYQAILNIDEDNEFAKENLKDLQVYQLLDDANQAIIEGDRTEAQAIYQQVLELEPNNELAKRYLEYRLSQEEN